MKVRATVTQTLSDRQGETVKTDKHYVGLSHKEIQALGSVTGEAFRLYVAVASFAYGRKKTAFPTWKQIGERMGKKLTAEAGQATAKRLEAAGLLKRGKFGSQNRWTLTLKEQILHPPTEGGESLNGDDGGPSEELIPPPNSYEGVNNKRNNRIKHSSLENKDGSLEDNESSDTETKVSSSEGPNITLSGGEKNFIEICNQLVKNPRNILGYNKKDRQRIITRLGAENLFPIITIVNRVLFPSRR